MLSLMNVCYSEIASGIVTVYNRYNEPVATGGSGYLEDMSGYILNAEVDFSKSWDDVSATPEIKQLTALSGETYPVGMELGEGVYAADGDGTIRVYSPDGYIKTVIKLKSPEAIQRMVLRAIDSALI